LSTTTVLGDDQAVESEKKQIVMSKVHNLKDNVDFKGEVV